MSTFTDSMDSVNFLGTDENSLETSRPIPSAPPTPELASPKPSGNVLRGKTAPNGQESSASISNSAALSQMLQKRRSSSRSIKRKKFDDELVESSLIKTNRSRQQPNPTPSTALGSLSTTTQSSGFTEPVTTETPAPPQIERKKSAKPSSKRAKKSKNFQAIVARDLGRWKPTDDLALIISVQQTNDLTIVHRGVKFSCKFTLKEIQERWYGLLYDSVISKMAVSAMKHIHPETIAAVQSKALFSQIEESMLGSILSTSQPTLETFQELLSQNHNVFYITRTAKSLYNHWLLMKQYHVLPDQSVHPLPKGDHMLNFSDAEDLVNDNDLLNPNDEVLEHELSLADRRVKREIRHLENELPKWQVLVDSVTGITPADFDNQTLAVLRGRLVRYLMRSKEISFGRATKDNTVDVDLSLEGPAWKISRRQGMIKLNSSGEFYVVNEGKRSLYVDGKPILGGSKCKLNNNSVVEISGLRFIFLINQELINVVRNEASKITS